MLKDIKINPEILEQFNQSWRREALHYWRKYIMNYKVIKRLRAENRRLRDLLSDYTNND